MEIWRYWSSRLMVGYSWKPGTADGGGIALESSKNNSTKEHEFMPGLESMPKNPASEFAVRLNHSMYAQGIVSCQ